MILLIILDHSEKYWTSAFASYDQGVAKDLSYSPWGV